MYSAMVAVLQRHPAMTFTKILCATDFSAGSEQAVRVATEIAIRAGAELVIAHSWFQPPPVYSLELPSPPELVQEIVDDAARGLAAAEKACKLAGLERVSSRLMTGIPWCKIVELVEKEGFDLCVIGTEGRTGLRRFLLGSVAEKVVRHAPSSVLAIHPDDAPKPISHVAVPTDFSPSAGYASDIAAGLVSDGGTITMFHVIEVPFAYPGQHPVRPMEIDLCRRASADLERIAKELQARTPARVRTETKIGHPAHETLTLLERDPSIDLVVVGSHGHTGLKRVLLGSVAEKIVRHARRPVLVARPRT